MQIEKPPDLHKKMVLKTDILSKIGNWPIEESTNS